MSLSGVSGPFSLAIVLAFLSGCSMDAYRHSSAGTYLGPPVAIGDGQAQTYVTEPEVPQGYVLPPGTEVPRMGAHAIDPASPEFHQKPFTHTFIFGFYDAEMIFLEPMASLEYLNTRPVVSAPVKQPEVYARRMYFPEIFAIRYNDGQQYYKIALEELVSR